MAVLLRRVLSGVFIPQITLANYCVSSAGLDARDTGQTRDRHFAPVCKVPHQQGHRASWACLRGTTPTLSIS